MMYAAYGARSAGQAGQMWRICMVAPQKSCVREAVSTEGHGRDAGPPLVLQLPWSSGRRASHSCQILLTIEAAHLSTGVRVLDMTRVLAGLLLDFLCSDYCTRVTSMKCMSLSLKY